MKRTGALVILTALLSACAVSDRGVVLGSEPWEQAVQRLGIDPAVSINPLAFDDAIQGAAIEMAGRGSPAQRLARLQQALFDRSSSTFEYEARRSLTAGEAFQTRSGNCLSFTNLFIAMGRALGYEVQAALPSHVRHSEKEGNLIIVNNHVVAAYLHPDGVVLYDFDRSRSGPPTDLRLIDDLLMTSLYLNNRGAELIQNGGLEDAEAHLHAATQLAPEFAGAWGNLAVARRRAGDTEGALSAYQRALDIEPDDPSILTNLASLYAYLGMPARAQSAIAAASVRAAAPDVLVVQADLRVQGGQLRQALRLYRRAQNLAGDRVEPLIGIARVQLARDKLRASRRAASAALRLDPDSEEATALLERVSASDH